MGTLAETINGQTCQRWDSQTPHSHKYNNIANFPDASLSEAANYCRNPDNATGGPWCYTTDPNKKWQYCDVKVCPNGKFKQVLQLIHGQEIYLCMATNLIKVAHQKDQHAHTNKKNKKLSVLFLLLSMAYFQKCC